MLARIRKSLDEKDSGFTLIELLVVMIIIGILAAIAIPVFLNQRKKAVDSSMKSDLRSTAVEMETMFTDTGSYGTVATAVAAGVSTATITSGAVTSAVKLSTGNTMTGVVKTGGAAYCLVIGRVSGQQAGSQANWFYISDAGGLQPTGTTACGTGYTTPTVP